MTPIPADQIILGLTDEQQDLVVREAHVRRRRTELLAELQQKQAQAAEFEQTRPPFFALRGKGVKTQFESQHRNLQEEVAKCEQSIANCDLILTKCTRIIEADIAHYLQEQSEDFRNAVAAQKLVPEWEQLLGLYRACLKQFVMTLGIARNQMSSGYDRKAGTFPPGAMAAIDAAVSAARTLESEVSNPNNLARRYRELRGLDVAPDATFPDHLTPLPYLVGAGIAKQVAALKTTSLETAQSRIGTLLEHCERVLDSGFPKLLEKLEEVRALADAEKTVFVTEPLSQIRAIADSSVDPERMGEICRAMEARFVTLTG